MSEGWFKIHRALFEKAIWISSTLEQKVILISILSMANHEKREWEWKGTKFKAEAGQFVTSLDGIVKKSGAGISVQNVRTALNKFERYGFITQEVTKTGRLIKIVNWEIYQGNFEKSNSLSKKQITKTSQSINKELTTNKNNKNNENYENDNNYDDEINYDVENNYNLQSNQGYENNYRNYSQNNNKDKYIKNGNDESSCKNYKNESNHNIDNNFNNNKDKKKIFIGEFTQNKLLIESIFDFMKMREKLKKPVTDKALKILLNKLNNLSQDEEIQIKILENSIEHCWQGLYPLKEENYSYGSTSKNITPGESRFNIKIPEWKPRSDTKFTKDRPF